MIRGNLPTSVAGRVQFTSKLKGERGVALSQHIMFNLKHIHSGGTRQDKLTPHKLL